MSYEKQIRMLLCEVLGNQECETIDTHADLAAYGMDSLNCMCLIIALEEAFHIEIPMEKLGMRFVRNIHDICTLVNEVAV